jgi:hypothetical protein
VQVVVTFDYQQLLFVLFFEKIKDTHPRSVSMAYSWLVARFSARRPRA